MFIHFLQNRLIPIFFILLFLLFSILQINDPDPFFWVTIYLLPVVLTIMILFNKMIYRLHYLGIIYLIASINIYIDNHLNSAVMYIFSETTNELIGLAICGIWILILPSFGKKVNNSKQIS